MLGNSSFGCLRQRSRYSACSPLFAHSGIHLNVNLGQKKLATVLHNLHKILTLCGLSKCEQGGLGNPSLIHEGKWRIIDKTFGCCIVGLDESRISLPIPQAFLSCKKWYSPFERIWGATSLGVHATHVYGLIATQILTSRNLPSDSAPF